MVGGGRRRALPRWEAASAGRPAVASAGRPAAASAGRPVGSRQELGKMGKMGKKRGGGEGLGGSAGQLQLFAGMDSAWASCEARFELPNSAWLRALFCMRPALLS
jgi:hypothetical protein